MNRAFIAGVATATAALLLAPTAGWTDAKAKNAKEDQTSGYVSVTGANIDNARQSPQFEEYRNVPELGAEVRVEHRPDNEHYYEFFGTHIGLDDQYERFTAQHFGEWTFRAIYDETPHRYALNALTIYSGEGTGTLTVDPALRTALQGLASTAVLPQATKQRNIATLLNTPGLAGAHLIDIQSLREKTTLQLDVAAWDPAYVALQFVNEDKTGTKPTLWTFGSSPGTPNIPEVAEPINYNTKQYKAATDYVRKRWSVGANYYRSEFKNKTPTLTFDNAMLTADGFVLNGNTAISGTSSRGLAVLPPSNQADYFTLSGSIGDLFWRSRLSATASWGQRTQNDPFQPFTINSSLAIPAGQAFRPNDIRLLGTNLSADAKVDTKLVDANWTARPTDKLRLKARYRTFDYENKTPEHVFVGRVVGDNAFAAGPFMQENISWKKTTTTVQASYDILKKSTVSLEYIRDDMDRHGREVERSKEDIWTVSSVTRCKDWLELKSSASTARRRGGYDPLRGQGFQGIEDFDDFQSQGGKSLAFFLGNANGSFTANSPLMRKYDQSDRDRDRAQLQVIAYPREDFTVTGFFQLNKDDFPDDFMGVQDTRQQTVGIDADWQGKQVTVNGFASREFLRRSMNSRAWALSATFASVAAATAAAGNNGNYYLSTPALAFNNPSNWSSVEETVTDTFGANVAYTIDPKTKKSGVDLGWLYTASDGRIDFLSPVGPAGGAGANLGDQNPFVPLGWNNVDDSRKTTLNVKYHNDFAKNWGFVTGYLNERLRFSDFNQDGLQLAPVKGTPAASVGSSTGLITMNTLVQPFNVHAFYSTLTYKF